MWEPKNICIAARIRLVSGKFWRWPAFNVWSRLLFRTGEESEMTPGIRPLVAGNWKMNGTGESLTELRAIAAGLSSDLGRKLDALICVPATLLSRAAKTLEGEAVALGGQDCHQNSSGAHTGDISAEMLKEAGASHVIVGHSERRADHRESNEIVRCKAQAAWKAG